MQDKEGRVTVHHAKISKISNYTNYFLLFITIFGLSKQYLEKNEYLCNRKQ